MSKSPKDTHGPVVATGPTRGKNRSRNSDGRWRARRSDAGKKREKKADDKPARKGWCILTTAACDHRGLPDDCHELQVLRQFRDDVLMGSDEGAALVAEYYAIAPDLVPLLDEGEVAERVWQAVRLTVTQIEAGGIEDAIGTYRGMVDELCRLNARVEPC